MAKFFESLKTSKVARDLIGTVAPTLATALGGPLAGVAINAITGKILGKNAASDSELLNAVLKAGPEDLVKLKELEVKFKTDMQNAGIELEEIAAHDRNSARERQVNMRDWTPSILGLAIIIGFFGVLAYLFRFGLPDEGSEVLLIMVGALGTMTSQVGNFFFGSSSGSKSKTAIISKLTSEARG